MSSDTAWIEEARRLHEAGTPVPIIFRALGKTEYAVRMALDLDGYCERKRQQAAAQKQRYKLAREAGGPVRKDKYRDRTKPAEELTPAKSKVTLPALSFLAKPIDEVKPAFRFAPKTHCRVEPPRVARIREIHRRMIRTGKVSAPYMEMQA